MPDTVDVDPLPAGVQVEPAVHLECAIFFGQSPTVCAAKAMMPLEDQSVVGTSGEFSALLEPQAITFPIADTIHKIEESLLGMVQGRGSAPFELARWFSVSRLRVLFEDRGNGCYPKVPERQPVTVGVA